MAGIVKIAAVPQAEKQGANAAPDLKPNTGILIKTFHQCPLGQPECLTGPQF